MKPSLLHPFLIAIAPILFLCAHNSDQVDLSYVLVPVAISLAAAAVLYGVAWLLLRSAARAAMVASLVLVLFFMYGHWFNVVWAWGIFEQSRYVHWTLWAMFGAILVGGIAWLARTRRPLEQASTGVAIAATLACAFSLVKIVSDSRIRFGDDRAAAKAVQRSVPPLDVDSPATPDIYYFILDGYVRGDKLKSLYKFDNSEFLTGLEQRGFYVADKSVSNYPMTYLSLASTLNMRYINAEIDKLGKRSRRRTPIYNLIHNHEVGRFLQSKGYRYVHFNTNYGGTETSDIADIKYSYHSEWMQSEFITVLMRTSALRIFEPSVAHMHLFAMEKVKEVPAIKGPTFTLVHLLLPHNPYVFDRNGNIRQNVPLDLQWTEKSGGWASKKEYVDQMVFLNRKMTEIVDELTARSPNPPIIILQGDHGSATTYVRNKAKKEQVQRFIRERTAILNAYRVPDTMKQRLYADISPVNTFRLLLDDLFDAKLEPVADRSFFSWYGRPHDVREVTKLVRRRSGAAADVPSTQPAAKMAGH